MESLVVILRCNRWHDPECNWKSWPGKVHSYARDRPSNARLSVAVVHPAYTYACMPGQRSHVPMTERSPVAFIALQSRDWKAPIYLQWDASLRGLGVALLQHDKHQKLQPIAFASKTLSPTEQRYSCIERELLAVVYGVERFHTYLYGRAFNIITDHKPLLMITEKPLIAAPPRLQCMLIRLQGYNFKMSYQPGKDNILADSLSRLPSNHNKNTVDLDVRVDLVQFSTEKTQHDSCMGGGLDVCLSTEVLMHMTYSLFPLGLCE